MQKKRIRKMVTSLILVLSMILAPIITGLGTIPAKAAEADTENLARGKTVTSGWESGIAADRLALITDGDNSANDYTTCIMDGRTNINPSAGAEDKMYVTIDLGESYDIAQIKYFGYIPADGGYTNTSRNMVFRLSDNADFEDDSTVTVFNTDSENIWGFGNGTDEEQINTPEGITIQLSEPVKARYVRYYQNRADQLPIPGALKWLTAGEIEVYGPEKESAIASFLPVTVSTLEGIAPVLPGTVTALHENNKQTTEQVIWDEIAPEKYAQAGEFTVNGTVEGTDIKPQIKVIVNKNENYTLQAGDATFVLDSTGVIQQILDKNGNDYTEGEDIPDASLIKLVMAPTAAEGGERSGKDGTEIKPVLLSKNDNVYTFVFGNGIEADVTVTAKEKYSVLEVTRLDKKGLDVELLMWGPITTNITENFGETLGIVYDSRFGIGMRGLNNKTQLTAPIEYSGWVSGRLNIVYPQDRSNFKGRVWPACYSGAIPTSWGSEIHAFTYDSTEERVRFTIVSSTTQQRVEPLEGEDAEIVGSKIALYGRDFGDLTAKEAVLDTISDMELAEGLPHPMIDGEWQKTSPEATKPYFIIPDLSTGASDSISKIEQASIYANAAGIDNVYKDTFFNTYGSETFNGGDEAMKAVVDKAAEYGVRVGTHSLSSFVNYGDPLVTTKEDKGTFAGMPLADLTQKAEAGTTELYVTDDWVNSGRTKQLGDDLFSVSSATREGDGYKLVLSAALKESHEAGETVYGLYNNQYGGLIAGVEQTKQIAARYAEAFNNTGLAQISFDGVEAGEYNGYSHYAVYYLENEFYNQLNPELQANFINDSSGGYPNAWHFNTRQNWGEPWGAAMRGGMIDYRYDNQLYFDRNFTPKMLGWFMYNGGQSTIDIEWMLSKSAGFDAGYALVTSLGTLNGNGNTAEVLEAIKQWQMAREIGAFTKDQQERMLDTSKDWHLEPTDEEEYWKLYCINYPINPVSKYYDSEYKEFDYSNPYHDQVPQVELRAVNGKLRNPVIVVNGQELSFEGEVPQNGYLIYKGGNTASIYDGTWHELKEVSVLADQEVIAKKGTQKVKYTFEADSDAVQGQLRIITQSYAEDVFAGNTANGPSEYPEDEGGIVTDNLAYKKPVTCGWDSGIAEANLAFITDGDNQPKDANTFVMEGRTNINPKAGPADKMYVTIDLGESYDISKIKYFGSIPSASGYTNMSRKMVFRLSNDPAFEDESTVTVFNTDSQNFWGFGEGTDKDEINTNEGRTIEFEPVNARYVRYYQNGADQLPAPGYLPWLSACEIEVYAHFDATEVKGVYVPEITTYQGIAPDLPSKATVVYGDDSTKEFNVVWDEVEEEAYQTPGRIEVTGTIPELEDMKATATVIVVDQPVGVLLGDDVVGENDVVTLTYGLQGVQNVSEQYVRVYFDKNLFAFNKEGEGIHVLADNTEVESFNVNNESALIDIHLTSSTPIADPSAVLRLEFTSKQAGIGKIELKDVRYIDADGEKTALCTGKRISVETGEEENPDAVNKVLLQKAYDYALTLSTDDVVDSAVKAFEEAVAEAKAVLDNPRATQDEVNAAWDNLLEGIWGLGIVKGDKTNLKLLIAKAESMTENADRYVAENWQQLLDALESAKIVDADGDALAEDIEPAAEELLNAILAQRYKANKSNLQSLVDKAEAMDLSVYTAASVNTLKVALMSARAVLEDATISIDDQETVDAMANALEAAITGLVAEDTGNTGDDGNIGDNGNNGDGGNGSSTGENNSGSTGNNGGTSGGNTTSGSHTSNPKTGDNANVLIWFSVILLTLGVCLTAAAAKKRIKR